MSNRTPRKEAIPTNHLTTENIPANPATPSSNAASGTINDFQIPSEIRKIKAVLEIATNQIAPVSTLESLHPTFNQSSTADTTDSKQRDTSKATIVAIATKTLAKVA